MAGANESPRNKLIALMYLVFITMLALNVSKEVLDGFGQMFKKIQSANERVNQGNVIYYDKIEVNAKKKKESGLVTTEPLKKSERNLTPSMLVFKKSKTSSQKSSVLPIQN